LLSSEETLNIHHTAAEKELPGLTIDPFMLAQEDVNLMKGLNFDAYRFSISWSRIFPGILGWTVASST
jgi:beta-glucosidase/6-phospho-beta-glucosidase/beta-galactosidase